MTLAICPTRASPETTSWIYPAAAIAVCVAGLIARLWQLSQAPNTLNADDLVAVRLAGHIVVGHGPGVLALDANGQVAISGYLQAFGLRLLGDQARVLRLPAALLGAGALPCFLLVARQLARPWPALGSTVLYGSSIYSLSVARSGWTNDFAAPLELLAIWLMLRSFTTERLALPLASGMACALAAYGYTPFRLLAAGMAPMLLLAGGAATQDRARRAGRWLVGYAPLICPLLIALAVQHDALRGYIAFHQINSRLPEYPPHTAAVWILARQAWAVVVGLALLVPGQVANLDLAHVPAGRWLLDGPAIALYWLGLWRLAGYRAVDRGDPLRRTSALWAWLLVGQVVPADGVIRHKIPRPYWAAYTCGRSTVAPGRDPECRRRRDVLGTLALMAAHGSTLGCLGAGNHAPLSRGDSGSACALGRGMPSGREPNSPGGTGPVDERPWCSSSPVRTDRENQRSCPTSLPGSRRRRGMSSRARTC